MTASVRLLEARLAIVTDSTDLPDATALVEPRADDDGERREHSDHRTLLIETTAVWLQSASLPAAKQRYRSYRKLMQG